MTSKARRESVSASSCSSSSSRRQTVGGIFRTARELQLISQDQLAALTEGIDGSKVSRTTISYIERGKTMPTLEAVVSLSRALGIEPASVVERIDLAMTLPVDFSGVTREELRRRAEECFWSGDYRGALAHYDAMLEKLALDTPAGSVDRQRQFARIEINRAVALRRCTALRSAQASAERAIDLATGENALQSQAYMVLAAVLSQRGCWSVAVDAAERAVTLAIGADPRTEVESWLQLGSVHYRSGRLAEAHRTYLRAREIADGSEEWQLHTRIEGNIGACLLEIGKLKSARRQLSKAIDLARHHKEPALEASWLVELGRLSHREARHDEAARHALAALAIAKPGGHLLTVFRAEWLRYLIDRERKPGSTDRHRLSYLKKLYFSLQEHDGLAEIREFKEAHIVPATTGESR